MNRATEPQPAPTGRWTRLLMLGLVTGLLQSSAAPVRAELLPNPLPKMVFGDLAVRVTAPAVLDGYQHLTTITVDNLDPYKTTPTVGGVSLVAYFTGVQPFVAQADSGFTCSIAKRETARWALSCSNGTIAAGASATIQVTVDDDPDWYFWEANCLRTWPAYTDVQVVGPVMEPNVANNRAVAVSDVAGDNSCFY